MRTPPKWNLIPSKLVTLLLLIGTVAAQQMASNPNRESVDRNEQGDVVPGL